MLSLFESRAAKEIKARISSLRPDCERQWGTMTVSQMLAHCSAWMETAAGLNAPQRSLLGRIVGPLAKSQMLGDAPVRRNMPTLKSLVVRDERDFVVEQQRLLEWIDRFARGGPDGCTKHPHQFFGPMTPVEWARLSYKHLDHHLRQFGA
jgi:hypothetical protein